MSQSFDIALIGAGGIARAHLAAASVSRRIRASVVVDPDPDARRKVEGAQEFDSVAALLASDARPRAAIVCTPPSVRMDVLRPLFEAGVPVLCEKPLARTGAEAESLVSLAARHRDVPGAVAYCHRFTPAVIEMKQRARAGELGTIVRFENTFACWHPAMEKGWMSDTSVSGGGSFIDTGCHSLDLYRFLCGDATVGGAVFHREWEGRGESNATVLLKPAGRGMTAKAAGVISSGWQEPDRFTLALIGTRGTLTYDYSKPTELFWTPSHAGQPETITVETHEVRFQRQLEAFIDWVARGGDEKSRGMLCSFMEAAAVARLVDEANAIGRPSC